MGDFRFVLGGARSGKSAFAQQLATAAGDPVVYVATAEVSDAEMAERIARHKRERPVIWNTVELPYDLSDAVGALVAPGDTVLIDCLSVWVSNELLARESDLVGEAADAIVRADAALTAQEALVGAVARLAAWAVDRPGSTIIVSNEVGSGIVPAYPLGRLYRDVLGRCNQAVAARAGQVYLVVAGIGVELKRLAAEFEAADDAG